MSRCVEHDRSPDEWGLCPLGEGCVLTPGVWVPTPKGVVTAVIGIEREEITDIVDAELPDGSYLVVLLADDEFGGGV